MPRPFGDTYGRARAGAVLRVAGLVVGFGLTTAGVWLIVTSTTAKDERIGALLGIWGVLLGAWALYATRHHDEVTEAGGAVAVRTPGGGLDTLNDAAALRAYELRLQEMLRREIHQTLGAELSALRSEVAALRNEVVEKVGGELRLERIETTRVIGSDIEALQREVRQLKSGHYGAELAATFGGPSVVTETVDAEVVDAPRPAAPSPTQPIAAVPVAAEPPPAAPVAAAPVAAAPVAAPPSAPATQTTPVAAAWEPPTVRLPQVEPDAVAPQPTPPAAVAAPANWIFDSDPVPPVASASTSEPFADTSARSDPFASLPRIRPFTEFELDPVESGEAQQSADAIPARHASADAGVSAPRSGGRRRREDGDGDDVLSRILERERQSG